jgi:hypothetical protein
MDPIENIDDQSPEDKAETESPKTSAFDYTIDANAVNQYVATIDPEAETFTVLVIPESKAAKTSADVLGKIRTLSIRSSSRLNTITAARLF